jgi:hypothetical protein
MSKVGSYSVTSLIIFFVYTEETFASRYKYFTDNVNTGHKASWQCEVAGTWRGTINRGYIYKTEYSTCTQNQEWMFTDYKMSGWMHGCIVNFRFITDYKQGMPSFCMHQNTLTTRELNYPTLHAFGSRTER